MEELSKVQLVSIIGGGQLSSLIGLPMAVKGPGREIPKPRPVQPPAEIM
ncbi:TPA: hypothetical protein U1312_001229 [Streptococcus suis]|nr:hypothetical protein [Streptococcus suis]HEM5160232.1 hypothetical protein [Streptococcus suis]HEM5196482.1 hypothetical protein [Streptococcus suis]HEM5265127.1 hypothetical protein [Streptococcus suis]